LLPILIIDFRNQSPKLSVSDLFQNDNDDSINTNSSVYSYVFFNKEQCQSAMTNSSYSIRGCSFHTLSIDVISGTNASLSLIMSISNFEYQSACPSPLLEGQPSPLFNQTNVHNVVKKGVMQL
jgi:hypothetical protein